MARKFFAAQFVRAAGWLTPRDRLEQRLRLELLGLFARNARPSAYATIPVAAALAAANLQWIAPAPTLAWFAAAVLSLLLIGVAAAHIRSRTYAPEEAGRLTLETALLMLPSMIVWPAMVPLVWVDGDPINSAYLFMFMCCSIVGVVAVYSAVLEVTILGVCLYLPILATHTVHGWHVLRWLGGPVQVVFGLIILNLARTFHTALRESFRQRLLNEDLIEQLGEARDRAERANRAKSVFLASMSHELRTPLNAIIGFSDTIRHGIFGPLSPAKYREYIEDIHASGNHLLSLINDVLDMAKIEAGKLELSAVELRVAEVAESALRLVEPQAAAAQVSLRMDVDGGLWLLADERAVTQILINLLSNAVKFSRPGGAVHLFAQIRPGGALALGVEDRGIGMSAEGLRLALTPFGQIENDMTVEGRGTGLGLPIVKALIEQHGAVFHIESAPTEGTRVWGEFPAGRVIARRAVA